LSVYIFLQVHNYIEQRLLTTIISYLPTNTYNLYKQKNTTIKEYQEMNAWFSQIWAGSISLCVNQNMYRYVDK